MESVHKEAVSAGKTLLKLLLPTGIRMFHSPSILKYYLSLWIFLPEKEFCKKPIIARSKQKNKSIIDFIFKILISNFLPLKKFLNVIFHSFLPAEIEKGKRLQCTLHSDRLQKHYLLLFRDIVKYLRTWSEIIKEKNSRSSHTSKYGEKYTASKQFLPLLQNKWVLVKKKPETFFYNIFQKIIIKVKVLNIKTCITTLNLNIVVTTTLGGITNKVSCKCTSDNQWYQCE